jgi:hypothetical protein
MIPPDKKRLLFAADGPEGIEIYTSEEEAICDFSPTIPALYLIATVQGASVKLGPFMCGDLVRAVQAALAPKGEG